MINIYNLATKPELINLVVEWLFNEWGKKQHHYNKNFWESWGRSSLSLDDIPQTYVAMDGRELVGSFSLWRCDVQSRQDLFPWLGGVIVKLNRRNEGIGSYMVRKAIRITKELGYGELFLSTQLIDYYDRLGWNYICNVPDENGRYLKLYRFDLSQKLEEIDERLSF